jgi:hypothetical protein
MKRMDRDEKLRRKFTPQHHLEAPIDALMSNSNSDAEDTMLMNDWQDVSLPNVPGSPRPLEQQEAAISSSPVLVGRNISDSDVVVSRGRDECSPLGQYLAHIAISEMSNAQVLVHTPTAAIALAIHSGLRNDTLGFKCTGIPEGDEWDKPSSAKKGFAAPVRELKKHQFLPDSWDRHAHRSSHPPKVLLRYRHDSVGAVTLRVTCEYPPESPTPTPHHPSAIIHIRFGPTIVSTPEHEDLMIPLEECFNVDSFELALGSTSKANSTHAGISPTLHYINLPILWSKFAQTFDLGDIRQDDLWTIGNDRMTDPRMMHNISSQVPCNITDSMTMVQDSFYTPPTHITQIYDNKDLTPRGDFADDQYPRLPSIHTHQDDNGSTWSGNLMGPNHPIFRRDWDETPRPNFILPGGLAMQPRFDPFYPPIVGGEPPAPLGRGRGRGGRGSNGQSGNRRPFPSSGDPNPDHQRPPSDWGGDMFM